MVPSCPSSTVSPPSHPINLSEGQLVMKTKLPPLPRSQKARGQAPGTTPGTMRVLQAARLHGRGPGSQTLPLLANRDNCTETKTECHKKEAKCYGDSKEKEGEVDGKQWEVPEWRLSRRAGLSQQSRRWWRQLCLPPTHTICSLAIAAQQCECSYSYGTVH